MAQKERQSNIELLRCLSMFFVIVYHILILVLYQRHPETNAYQALELPFHIGVPLFVMISGYFGIRFSIRGLSRLASKAYVYLIPCSVIAMTMAGTFTIKGIFKSLMIFSFDNLWFLNVYLYLFLLSPFVNKALDNITDKQRWYLLGALSFITVWIGGLTEADGYLLEGKNVLHFILLYAIGNTIHHYQKKINRIPQAKIVGAYLVLNVALTLGFMYLPASLAGKIWKYSFGYNSPVMILNCVLFFMIFTKLHFYSKWVNWAGGSIFACYLLQSPELTWKNIMEIPSQMIDAYLGTLWLTVPAVIVYTILAMFVFCCFDKLLNPLWNVITRKAVRLDEKLGTKELL